MLARVRTTIGAGINVRTAARLDAEIDGSPDPDAGVFGLPFAPLQPLDRVVSALSLETSDTDLLALALVSHRYASAAAAYRELHPQDQPWPTVGLAVTMAEAGRIAGLDSWSSLGEALTRSPLVAAGALVVDTTAPMSERSLRPAEGLWEALTGLGGWPGGLTVDHLPTPMEGLAGWSERPIVRAVAEAVREGTATAFSAVSDRPETAAARLGALVMSTGRTPVILRTPTLTSGLVQLALVLAVARDVVPVFCEYADPASPAEVQAPYVGLPLLLTRASSQLTTWPRPLVTIPVTSLSLDDRQAALRSSGGGVQLSESAAPATAEPRDLELAGADLQAHLAVTGPISEPEARRVFLGAVDRRTRGLLPPGGKLTHPQRSWDSLVVASDRMVLLQEAVARARMQAEWNASTGPPSMHAGDRGLRLLFSGPPGTGKTLAAEVMAPRAGSRSSWASTSPAWSRSGSARPRRTWTPSSTQPNAATCVLFFDEADALFGQAHRGRPTPATATPTSRRPTCSRRLERFDGVVVLATNLRATSTRPSPGAWSS